MDGEADEVSDGRDGWMFLLVPAYPGSPGPTAVKPLCVFSNNIRSTSQKYNKRAIKRVCVCEQNMLIQLSTGIYLFL